MFCAFENALREIALYRGGIPPISLARDFGGDGAVEERWCLCKHFMGDKSSLGFYMKFAN